MRDIYGRDVGSTISFRGAIPDQEMRHPWPDETHVSAGRGVVFVRGTTDSYRTLFIEVYPPGASFIRGEGETPEQCEDACWAKYQLALNCVEGHEHKWAPYVTRKDGTAGDRYKNGAGFCVHCNTFATEVFTRENLG